MFTLMMADYLDDKTSSGDPGNFRHLPNVGQSVDIHPGAVRDLPHAVVRRAGVFASIFRLDVGYVHVTDDVVLHGNVLT